MLETATPQLQQQQRAEDVKRLDYVDLKLSQKRQQVKLRTCADVYAHWRAYKRAYRKAPREGVEFQIDYIDTGLAMDEEERARAPIALALHGAPGSYHDFSLLIQHLASQRVRVIAPNFPEYVATVKTKVLFRHSADEKAAYLRDFLRAINVRTIDLLISHSSAIFPSLLILLNANQGAIGRQNQRASEGRPTDDARGAQDTLTQKTTQKTRQKTQQTRQREQQRDEDSATGSFSEIEANSQLNDDDDESALRTTTEPELEFEDASEELDDNNNNARARQKIPAAEASAAPSESSGTSTADVSELAATADNQQQQQVVARLEPEAPGADEQEQERRKSTSARTELRLSSKKSKKAAAAAARKKRSTLEPIVQFDEPIEIRAVALFNPAGHRMPKSMKPVWFKCGAVHVYQQKLGRSLFRKFGPAFLTVIGEVVRVENMDHVMLSATVMRNSKCQRVVSQLEQLSQMKVPTLLVFSENDKLIEREIFYEMTQFMRLDPRNFDVFQNEADVELSQSRSVDDWIRVMVFKAGGHYAYSNYAKTVNTAVSELLAKVCPRLQQPQSPTQGPAQPADQNEDNNNNNENENNENNNENKTQ